MVASHRPCRKLRGWWQKCQLRAKGAALTGAQEPWEADYELLPCEGLFEEYLEMGEGVPRDGWGSTQRRVREYPETGGGVPGDGWRSTQREAGGAVPGGGSGPAGRRWGAGGCC